MYGKINRNYKKKFFKIQMLFLKNFGKKRIKNKKFRICLIKIFKKFQKSEIMCCLQDKT